jgi:hypothetical protein
MRARRQQWSSAAILAIAASMVVPAGGAAQGQASWILNRGAGSVMADDLHARAASLFTRPDRYRVAADLLVRAAQVRAEDDAASVNELIVAGKLYAYANSIGTARRTLEEAAERALRFGDVVRAAHASLDAAFLAIQQADRNGVRELSARAERLAAAPHLSDTQRADILSRINPDRLAAARR